MFRLLLLALALLAFRAQAQIEVTTPARQRSANRQALREVRQAEAPYKDSHLEVGRQQLRRGTSDAAPRVADEPRFGRNGVPRVKAPLFPGWRRRRIKNEPKP